MPVFRKKPVKVEATQWFKPGDHPAVGLKVTLDGCLRETCADNQGDHGVIETLEGAMEVCPGDWIVGPGVAGEFWPVKPAIFAKTYWQTQQDDPAIEHEYNTDAPIWRAGFMVSAMLTTAEERGETDLFNALTQVLGWIGDAIDGIEVDAKAEAAYVRLRPGPVQETVADVMVNVDFNADREMVGIEFDTWPPTEALAAIRSARDKEWCAALMEADSYTREAILKKFNELRRDA